MRVVAVALATAALAACAAPPPPPPPPASVTLLFDAASGTNPGPDGRGAPVMLRVYELGGATAFAGAGFFDLFDNDAKLLGADLVHRDTVVLPPGQARRITLAPPDRATAIGVFAVLRDPGAGTWRVVVPIRPHASTTVAIPVGAAGLGKPAPAAAPAPGTSG